MRHRLLEAVDERRDIVRECQLSVDLDRRLACDVFKMREQMVSARRLRRAPEKTPPYAHALILFRRARERNSEVMR